MLREHAIRKIKTNAMLSLKKYIHFILTEDDTLICPSVDYTAMCTSLQVANNVCNLYIYK